jgi:hypothetical protein
MEYVIRVCRQHSSSSRIRMERQDGTAVPYWSCCYSKAVYKPVWHIPLLSVQWKPPDNGQRNCLNHVDFHSKNKFEKLVHLVGFIIRKKGFVVSHHVKLYESLKAYLWQSQIKIEILIDNPICHLAVLRECQLQLQQVRSVWALYCWSRLEMYHTLVCFPIQLWLFSIS